MKCYLKHLLEFALLTAITLPVHATELVYRFVSPSFGGNPLNGNFLLNQAEQQNDFKDPSAQSKRSGSGQPPKSDLERFKDRLQQAILNKIAQNATGDLFDENGNIVLGSNLNFDMNGDGNSDFSIVVDTSPDANGNVTINLSDGITETILTVPYSTP